MKKLIGFLFIFLVFSPSLFSEEDGLSNDDNPPGLQEYLKQLEIQKKSKSGFHVYSDEGKEALQSDMGSDFVPIQKRTKKEMSREDKLRRQRTLLVKKNCGPGVSKESRRNDE